MDDRQLRLECLNSVMRMSVLLSPSELVEAAEKFYAFATGQKAAATTATKRKKRGR